jgi:hypothetical protein
VLINRNARQQGYLVHQLSLLMGRCLLVPSRMKNSKTLLEKVNEFNTNLYRLKTNLQEGILNEKGHREENQTQPSKERA